ncbi:MAG TPA: SRPBCC family protein [Microbacteriaceae bacterium]|nr:SRPBCC family protein [Microbacteriaceae bacterium]
MPVIEESVLVHRPPQEVFDYVTKTENIPIWESSVITADQVGTEPMGLGVRSKGTSKIMGRHFDWITEVVEYDRPRRFANRSVEGTLEFTVTLALEPAGDGTRLTYRIDAASGLGGIFGRLADPFVERAQARTVRANLDTLAELLAENPDS